MAERACMLYAGTTVLTGTAVTIVTAVGGATEARRATAMAPAQVREVGLQARLSTLTRRALPVSLGGGVLVAALGLLRGTGIRAAVTSGVAVTVAAVPEGLTLVATLAQVASARRLTKRSTLVRAPRSIEALSRVDVVCFDKTGTLSENRLRVVTVEAPPGFTRQDVLAYAARTGIPANGGAPEHATDVAIVESAHAAAVADRAAERTAHLPFRSGRAYAAAIAGNHLAVKGAPETMLGAYGDDSPELRERVHALAAEGLRVIAVGQRDLNHSETDWATDDPDALAELCGNGLRHVGLIGLSDTPRADAAGLLPALLEQGVAVRLVTGDHPVTAVAIAAELGLPVGTDQVLSGAEWDGLSHTERKHAVEQCLVFARMSPEHKVQIVQTLEHAGHVCAMVGDGANDAAAIRAASVGIGVASHGSDPARGAADVVLLEGRVAGLLDALDEGRVLWQRVQAAVAVLLGGNAGEVAFALLGSLVTGRSPLNARQLLLVNMLTDALPAAALAVSTPPHRRLRSRAAARRVRAPAHRGRPRRHYRGRGHRGLGHGTDDGLERACIDGGARRARGRSARADPARLAQPPRRRHRPRLARRDGRTDQHAGGERTAGLRADRPGGVDPGTRVRGSSHRARRRRLDRRATATGDRRGGDVGACAARTRRRFRDPGSHGPSGRAGRGERSSREAGRRARRAYHAGRRVHRRTPGPSIRRPTCSPAGLVHRRHPTRPDPTPRGVRAWISRRADRCSVATPCPGHPVHTVPWAPRPHRALGTRPTPCPGHPVHTAPWAPGDMPMRSTPLDPARGQWPRTQRAGTETCRT